MNKKVEILAPAGSYECLKAAISAGADAVYIGGAMFGARAYAKNLSEEELIEAIDYVHIHGRKLYLTVNTLLKDQELESLYDYLLPYYVHGLDGVIVQDIGAVCYIQEHFPELPVHASTQMTITGALGAEVMKRQGMTRVVPARELSLGEVKEIKEKTGLEVECFVHGAMCYCYSGQCLLSSMIGGRSGNRGQCAQPCRLPYHLESNKPSDLMSLKDMCTINLIPELIEAGIDSFKIEGRMKQPEYVYTVVSIYRKYVDLYEQCGTSRYRVKKEDLEKLYAAYKRRGYSQGYYKQHNGKEMISFKRPNDKEEPLAVPEIKLQEKINGKLILLKNKCAKIVLRYGKYQIECEGALCEEAKRQPLDMERVEKQIRKMGNTEYRLENLDIVMDSDVFLPMQALNELRRNAIESLNNMILSEFGRELPYLTKGEEKMTDRQVNRVTGRSRMSALVREVEQLETVADADFLDEIYIESSLCLQVKVLEVVNILQQKGKKVYAALPYIFRVPTVKQMENMYDILHNIYDGVLIRNYEEIEWLRKHAYDKVVHSDYNMYIFNQRAKEWMGGQNISECTAPVELNEREWKRLGIADCMYIGYGYQPVMITAGCIRKTTDACDRKNQKLMIYDRYQKGFYVSMNCDYCYNVIYNSAPLYLADQPEILNRIQSKKIRLDFSRENKQETRKVLEAYYKAWNCKESVPYLGHDYTRGHIKRGVK